MNDENLKTLFFVIAKEIKERCNQIDAYSCENAKCPFARKDKDGNCVCIFDWNNFGSPYDWEFGDDVNDDE